MRSDDESLDVARGIIERCGLPAGAISPISNRGSVNHVFHLITPAGQDDAVIRFAIDDCRPDETELEAWALRAAGIAGIPSPAVLARGVYNGRPFLVQTYIPASPSIRSDGHELWQQLGRYAAVIATIPVPPSAPAGLFTRFGTTLPTAWQAHVDYHLDSLTDNDPLLDLRVYTRWQQPQLRDLIQLTSRQTWTHGLAHRDLHPRNVIIDTRGTPVLLDWGTAQTGPTPWLDAAQAVRTHLTTNSPTATELDAFLDGCALPPDARVHLEALVVISTLDLVRWSTANRTDLTPGLTAEAGHLVSRLLGPSR